MLNNFQDDRNIRVFISSTFKDMQREREILMTRVFPKLRKIALERDVTLLEVDLRWGITEKDANNGRVLEICLNEIDRSIPFFIGIIGGRYGWIPDASDVGENIKERYEEINHFLAEGLSVTEIEMQYGVLRRRENLDAIFYFKSFPETEWIDSADSVKIDSLKSAIINDKRYPVESYDSPEDLADKVEMSFMRVLNKYFPENDNSFDKKCEGLKSSYYRNLCRWYVPNNEELSYLDSWATNSKSTNLAVVGESGVGKSSLLAYWYYTRLESQFGKLIYIPANLCEGCISNVYRYLLHEINPQIIDCDTTDEDDIRKQIVSYLNKFTRNGQKVIFIVDDNPGISTLISFFIELQALSPIKIMIGTRSKENLFDEDEKRDREFDDLFNWINSSTKMPNGNDIESIEVHSSGKSIGFDIYELNFKDKSRIEKIVINFLGSYAKTLSAEQLSLVCESDFAKNPRKLFAFLYDIISFGSHNKIDEFISYYLANEDTVPFETKYIERACSKFKGEPFARIIKSISITRSGIREQDLISISRCTPLEWGEFQYVIDPYISRIDGKVNITDKELSNSLDYYFWRHERDAHLEDIEIRKRYIDILRDRTDTWSIIERAYQLFQLSLSEEENNVSYGIYGATGLMNYLSNPCIFNVLYDYAYFDLIDYWEDFIYLSKGSLDVYCENKYDYEDVPVILKLAKFALKLGKASDEDFAIKIAQLGIALSEPRKDKKSIYLSKQLSSIISWAKMRINA